MAHSHSTQNDAFNTLLSRLHDVAGLLAQQYQEDVEAALNENKKLRRTLDRGSAGNIEGGQNREKPFPEALVFTSAGDVDDRVPCERTCISMENRFEKVQTLEKTQELQEPLASPNCIPLESSQVSILMPEDIASSPSADSQNTVTAHPQKLLMQAFSSKKTPRAHFVMRSPYIDKRDLDTVTLKDIMSEDMYGACIARSVSGMRRSTIRIFDPSTLVQSSHLSSCIIHPESTARGWWVLACMAFIMYDLVMIPIEVCFDLKETTFSKAMDITAATFWTVDIALTFLVGVRRAHDVEMNPFKIASVYLKSWFIFDLFLVVPEWATLAITDDSFSGGQQVSVFRMARWGRLMRLFRMARIVKLGKLKPLLRRLVYVFNLSKAYIQLIQAFAVLTFALIASTHVMSCFWYAIGNASDDGWVMANGLESASVGRAYVASVHWSFCRLHGLKTYNRIESVTELLLDALLIFLSLIIAAYYTGTVAAIALTSANAQSHNLWRLSGLFVRKYKISSHLSKKMERFLECSTVGGALETSAEELQLLESLPKTLQHDLLFEARLPYLSRKTFILDLLAANSRTIHRISNEAFIQKVYVDGEVVFANGDACHGMLFITSGVLFYILDNSNGESLESFQERLYNPMNIAPLRASDSSTRQLVAKSSVSEPVLWTHWTHMGSLLTIEESTSLVLSHHGFSHAVAEHRESFCYAFKYAKRFLWYLNDQLLHAEDGIDDLLSFPQITIEDLDTDMFEGTEYDHFIFLSHYKVEGGTEATLMRDLLQDILRENPTHSANNLRSPIFVDSEDLADLSKLKEHVIGSAAFVLLLTPGVLSRPWCLVEIVTAVSHNVNIIPVEIQRPGSRYDYPDDQFFANILDGKFLNQSAVELLQGEGISLSDVEQSIRRVFLKIAVPFSPHKTKGVREAEVNIILSRCASGYRYQQSNTSA